MQGDIKSGNRSAISLTNTDETLIFKEAEAGKEFKLNFKKKTISIQSHCPLFIAFLLLSLMQLRLTDQSTAGHSAQRRSERGCCFSACVFNSNPHCVLSKEQYHSILLDIVETDMKICSTTM